MLDFVEKHGIESICEIYAWDKFGEALDKLEKGKPRFRCVVDVEPES